MSVIALETSHQTQPLRQFHSIHWQAFLVAIIALVVLIPRGLSIARAQTLRTDDGYHLLRGIRFWHRDIPTDWLMNDPPLGEAISAIPILRSKELVPHDRITEFDVIEKLSQRGMNRIAVFKSILFVPAVVLVFWWVAGVYNTEAGWLAAALLLIDPTFAAHIPLPSIDALGAETILFAYFFIWRFLANPGWGRGASAGVFMAIAMLTKHTAVILPAVAVITAGLWWFVSPIVSRPGIRQWLRHMGWGIVIGIFAAIVFAVSLWALTLFDLSLPHLPPFWPGQVPAWAMRLTQLPHPLPAGIYITSLLAAVSHAQQGHAGVLFGQVREHGWWYYGPAIATMKIPLSFFVVFILAIGSLFFARPRWHEWSLLLPAIAWAIFLMSSKLSIGFRHFLPAYVFLLMLSGRALLVRGAWWRIITWCSVTWAAVNVFNWQPDYLSYANRDIDQIWLKMSDSNIDWAQSDKQVGEWIAAHVPANRPVMLLDFSTKPRPKWAGANVTIGDRDLDLSKQPTTGLYIVSPNWVTGQYDDQDRLRALRNIRPTDIIAHSMLVYDLDVAGGGKPFNWYAPTKSLCVPEDP